MGGTGVRVSAALVLASCLIATSIASPATWAAQENDDVPAGPPAGAEPEIRAKVDWDHAEHLAFQYMLTNAPMAYPFDQDNVSNIAGCPGAEDGGPITPIVLRPSDITFHMDGKPLQLVVLAQGVCSIHDSLEQREIAVGLGRETIVRATIEYWAAGAKAPYDVQVLDAITAPIFGSESNQAPYRRAFSPTIIMPTAEQFAAAADLPGLSPEIGATEVAAPPDSYGDSPESDATDGAGVPDRSKDGPSPPRREMTESDVYFVVLVVLLLRPKAGLEILLSGGAMDLVNVLMEDPDVAAATDPDALEVAEVDNPLPDESESSATTSDGPPDMKLKPGRRWVQPGEEFSVRHDGEKHDLRPGTWYQAKEVDGKLRLFDQRGRLLGSVKASGPKAAMLSPQKSRKSESSPDESTDVDDTTQPSQVAPVLRPEDLIFKPETATDLMRLFFAHQVVNERLPQVQRDKAADQLALFDQLLVPEEDPRLPQASDRQSATDAN